MADFRPAADWSYGFQIVGSNGRTVYIPGFRQVDGAGAAVTPLSMDRVATASANGDGGVTRFSAGGTASPLAVALYGITTGGVTQSITADSTGVFTVPGTLPAGTDRSGSATTSSTTAIAANAARRGLNIQNIGANNIGVNEFGGTAAIGTAGTYTLAPGASMNVRTNRAITMIAATGATAFSATEF